ncbi:MAG TPA: hypothetical protein VN692_17820 [Steroidobacteraceae bacterium]|nr:hypothetical protein [Steroidobacteraceae bacterium]
MKCSRAGFRLAHVLIACAAGLVCASPANAGDASGLHEAEQRYAAFLDAYGAREAIDSGLLHQVDGKDRPYWDRRFATERHALEVSLRGLSGRALSGGDAALSASLQAGLAYFGDESTSASPDARCADASRPATADGPLREALVSCFREIGNRIQFEGHEMTRVAALQLLQSLEPATRREQLFQALRPLWQAIDGDNGPTSPYRRVIASAAAEASAHGSPIDAAARSLGWSIPELESALVQVLEAWRTAAVVGEVEPWNYRFRYAAASHVLNPLLSREALQPIQLRYFGDLGADPRRLGVAYDLDPRAGKAPFAYTDFIRIGRQVDGAWRSARVRVSDSVESGGLFTLEELVHETGHAVHLMGIRARPAYFWPDMFLSEAFANVPGWSVYEPAWQQRYLGRAVCRGDGLRERYALAMLDVAWSLFEIQMLRDPKADPNRVWTDITSHYLGIKPHPDWAWWALRTQLVSTPGYMVNYGAGAILTADLRATIEQSIGPFDAGNPRWYPWLSAHLFRFGSELPTKQLLRQLLGRAPSPVALISEIRGMPASASTCH